MIIKKNCLERQIQTFFYSILIVLLGLCVLVPSVYVERSVWSIEIVDSTTSTNGFGVTSLSLDSSGYPHISYLDSYPTNDLKYAYKDSGGWHTTIVDSGGDVGMDNSLALDSNDYPHISYYDSSNGDLKYAYKDSAGWHIQTVFSFENAGIYSSLALDSNDYPHISHGIVAPINVFDLLYTYRDNSGWHNLTVDSSGQVGYHTSLVMNSSDIPLISYYDFTNSALKYAYKSSISDVWYTTTVDNTGVVGQYTSLAVDSNDYPHISYFDVTNSALKYAYMDSGGWHNVTVDNTGDVGGYTSLAMDSDNYPHISYHDGYSNYDLKYAYLDGAGWHISTVDSTEDVGQYTSLALDNNGNPHISYTDSTNGNLKYARLTSDTTPPQISNVDDFPDPQIPGDHVNITCDVTDNVAVNTVKVNITYPDTSTVNVTMNMGSFYYNSTYSTTGIYTYFIWANDTNGNTNTSSIHQFIILQPTVDYIQITYTPNGSPIPDDNIATNTTLICYASSYNTTFGYLGTVTTTWSVTNTGGSNASLNSTMGKSIVYDSGWFDGQATLLVEDGEGHTYSVNFTINSSMVSMLLYTGWNLVTIPVQNSWTAEKLGENITGCTIVIKFKGDTQTFTTHIVGVPWDNFFIEDGVGYFVYVTGDTLFTFLDVVIESINVSIYQEWNMIGWCHNYSTVAESLGENITGCTLILMFDAETQNFLTHVVGTPWDNFAIDRGMASFIFTTVGSYWHGEG